VNVNGAVKQVPRAGQPGRQKQPVAVTALV